MSQAKRDQNRVPALIAVSSVDSSTPLVIEGDPTTKGLNVNIVGDDASLATSAGQLADGHNVTVDNAAGSGVYVRPGTSATFTVVNTSIDGPGAPTIDSYTQASINLNAGNDQVLVSSAANKQIWVYGFGFTLSVAGTVSFQDESDTAITGIMDFAANSGMAIAPSGNFAMPVWKLGTDKDLEVDIVTAALDGFLTYAIVSV